MKKDLVEKLGAVNLRRGLWTAQVTPGHGMNTLSLRYDGRPVLRSPKTMEEYLQLPEGFGTPPLLPANRTRDGVFDFEGKRYSLPINDRFHTHKHGYVHTSAFTVTALTEDSVEGVLENHGEIYPFPFRFVSRAELRDDGLYQTYTLTNIGLGNMPVIFAVHAAFTEPKTCYIPVQQIWLADDRCLPTMEKAPLPAELEAYTNGSPRSDVPVGYCCPSEGNAVELDDMIYEVSNQFTQWIVWNGDGHQGFLCVEPQTAPSNVLCREGEALVLKSGESVRFTARIYKK